VASEQVNAGGSPKATSQRGSKRRKTGVPTCDESEPGAEAGENNKSRMKLTTESLEKAMDTDEKPKTRKVKKQVRKGELPIVSATQALEATAKNSAVEREAAMVMEDKLVADTEEKKNELETYIYELRNKLDDQYSEFASEEEKDKIRSKLTDTEVRLVQPLRSGKMTSKILTAVCE
jgi:heat shock protein 4